LDEQEEIRWFRLPTQPSLQEAGVEREPLGAVFSFLQEGEEIPFIAVALAICALCVRYSHTALSVLPADDPLVLSVHAASFTPPYTTPPRERI
jgi:hypothetical protein